MLFFNPGTDWQTVPKEGQGRGQVLLLQASSSWLLGRFPAAVEEINPRIRQLADVLAVEALNDQFLSPERLEFTPAPEVALL